MGNAQVKTYEIGNQDEEYEPKQQIQTDPQERKGGTSTTWWQASQAGGGWRAACATQPGPLWMG